MAGPQKQRLNSEHSKSDQAKLISASFSQVEAKERKKKKTQMNISYFFMTNDFFFLATLQVLNQSEEPNDEQR